MRLRHGEDFALWELRVPGNFAAESNRTQAATKSPPIDGLRRRANTLLYCILNSSRGKPAVLAWIIVAPIIAMLLRLAISRAREYGPRLRAMTV